MADHPFLESETALLRRRNRELSVLNTIAGALSGTVDLDEVLRATLAQVAELLDLSTGWVWLMHESNGKSYLAAAQNLPPALASNPRRMEGWCHCLDTYESGDLSGAANINIITCTRLKGLVDGTNGLRYHASIPLYAQEKKLGVLNLASADWRELSPDDLRLLHTIGDLLSIAVERARLFAQTGQLAAIEERNRIAREIHDTLAQGLSAVALHLESADALLDGDAAPERIRASVRRALDITRENLDEARRSVLDLRAATLEGRSLSDALRMLVRAWASADGPRLRFMATGANQPLPQRIEVGLYRIAQEALTNALRHAGARQITIRLINTPTETRCVIRDDGRGFDPAHLPEGHYGLIGLHERAKLLGGTMQITSTPGKGTRVDVTVPLEVKR